jgi:hypothetical protein
VEYYERYRNFEKRETNPLIDEPVIFFRGFTKKEILVGVFMFVVAIYISAQSMLLMLLFAFLSATAPLSMQYFRVNLPKNYFFHFAWNYGFLEGENFEFNRPQKGYFTL